LSALTTVNDIIDLEQLNVKPAFRQALIQADFIPASRRRVSVAYPPYFFTRSLSCCILIYKPYGRRDSKLILFFCAFF